MTKRARIFRSSNPPAIQGNAVVPSKRPPGRPKGAKDEEKEEELEYLYYYYIYCVLYL